MANLAALPVSKKQKVFIYGFKDCFNWGREKGEEFNEGTLVSIQNTNIDEGYTLKYTNPTIKGMSGSPVFDTSGRVIAIHGKPGYGNKGESCDSALTEAFGNNYGIPIESFINSRLASKLQGKLLFDKKPVEVVMPTNNKSGELDQSPDVPVRFKKSNN